MAKLMGIDYGTKRVGVAVTDESGSVAFPKAAIPNDRMLMTVLTEMIRADDIDEVIIGESKDKDGVENTIMKNVRTFAGDLERATSVTIHFEPEYYSSQEARTHSGTSSLVDAQAAAIILNSFLTKRHGNHD